MAKRLWEKGEALDQLVHHFTIGNDPIIDARLARWDCIGSAAHAKMLRSIGILESEETAALLQELKAILQESDATGIEIPYELEDIHTAIETRLTERLGEAGKRIHTGRSRNDQILVTMRLYLRASMVQLVSRLDALVQTAMKRIDDVGGVPMPGYTHMQPAMPSSVGMWLHALVEASLELCREGLALLEAMDSNPLGAAAGFGVPLPLDRDLTAKLLGFSRVQRSVINAQNSRGRYELRVARWCVDVSALCEKFASDMILYTMREFRFFSLPNALTTGSSIMPQKHNPDVLELVRGRAGRVRGAATEIDAITAKLPSNFHRDFQYSKEPAMRAIDDTTAVLEVMERVLALFTVNADALTAAMYPDLYVTYDVYRLVREGKPFREAYQETAARIGKAETDVAKLAPDFAIVNARFTQDLRDAATERQSITAAVDRWSELLTKVEREIFGEGAQ